MSVESEIAYLKVNVEKILQLLQQQQCIVIRAAKKGSGRKRKDEIEDSIEKCWNARHPQFPFIRS